MSINIEALAYMAHSLLPAYEKRVDAAMGIIREGLEIARSPFLSCSFGKDSVVMLHMVRTVYPTIPVRFIQWAESNILDNYDEVIQQWRDLGANISILHLKRESLNDSVADRWEQMQAMDDCDGYFIGLRAEESHDRRRSLKKFGAIHRIKASGLYRIAPIAWLKTIDIAAYTIKHDLPILSTYIAEGFSARTASRVPREAHGIRQQSLDALKLRDRNRFEQLARLYPEVENYV